MGKRQLIFIPGRTSMQRLAQWGQKIWPFGVLRVIQSRWREEKGGDERRLEQKAGSRGQKALTLRGVWNSPRRNEQH